MGSVDKPNRNWIRSAFLSLASLLFAYWVFLAGEFLWDGRDESLIQLDEINSCVPVSLHRPRFLLRIGADPNYISPEWHWGLLHSAALFGQVELVELLLEYGADPDLKTAGPDGPLTAIYHACIRAERPAVSPTRVGSIIPARPVTGTRSRGECPERRLAVIETLLAHGASPGSIAESCEFHAQLTGAEHAASARSVNR